MDITDACNRGLTRIPGLNAIDNKRSMTGGDGLNFEFFFKAEFSQQVVVDVPGGIDSNHLFMQCHCLFSGQKNS